MLVLAVLPLTCAACANDAGPYRLGSPASASPGALSAAQASGIGVLPVQAGSGHKTTSDKIFAAMALERVTGRKPDPGRLIVDRP
jgi:hypothetical protein